MKLVYDSRWDWLRIVTKASGSRRMSSHSIAVNRLSKEKSYSRLSGFRSDVDLKGLRIQTRAVRLSSDDVSPSTKAASVIRVPELKKTGSRLITVGRRRSLGIMTIKKLNED
jgi:hypothetical protein